MAARARRVDQRGQCAVVVERQEHVRPGEHIQQVLVGAREQVRQRVAFTGIAVLRWTTGTCETSETGSSSTFLTRGEVGDIYRKCMHY